MKVNRNPCTDRIVKYLSTSFLILVTSMSVEGKLADTTLYPIIGKRCPEFVLTDVHNYSSTRITLDDLKGKYVILDFWGEGCVSCMKSFPKLNKLQRQFKDNLLIVLVGAESKGIRQLYEKYRKALNLELVSAYDSTLFGPPFRPGIVGVPWCVWIDKDGIVTAVTSSSDVNKENIEHFLNGRSFPFSDLSYNNNQMEKSAYDPERLFLIDENGGSKDTSFLYRSILSQWKPGMGNYMPNAIDVWIRPWVKNKTPKFETLKCPLLWLYTLAYFGKTGIPDSIFQRPILETRDSLLFKSIYTNSTDTYYCYSLSTPLEKASKEDFMRIMQADLSNYFGYEVSIENRAVPCILLKAIDKKKIRTRGGESKRRWTPTGAQYINRPITELVNDLNTSLNNNISLVDDTGIEENIDLTIDAIMTDITSLERELQRNGLRLEKGFRKMKAMIIKDRNN